MVAKVENYLISHLQRLGVSWGKSMRELCSYSSMDSLIEVPSTFGYPRCPLDTELKEN